MLSLHFEGYFQNRLATDPDPSDELRGVSGFTFALPGEPNFDRVIHLQPDEDGVFQRPYGVGENALDGPQIGVTVRESSDPTLIGAKVRLAPINGIGSQFVEENGIVTAVACPMLHPFRIQIIRSDGNVVVDREDYLNGIDHSTPIWEATHEMIVRRQSMHAEIPQGREWCYEPNSKRVAEATGIGSNDTDYIENRNRRRRNLEELLKTLQQSQEKDERQILALEKRIAELNQLYVYWDLSVPDRPVGRRAASLGYCLYGFAVDINGKINRNDVGGAPEKQWQFKAWFGGWDPDALCAYMKGSLMIPTGE